MFDMSQKIIDHGLSMVRLNGRTVQTAFDTRRRRYEIRFGFENADGEVRITEGGCHGSLFDLPSFTNNKRAPLTKFISCLIGSANHREKYWTDLFSDASPYRSLFKDLEIHRHSTEGDPIAWSVSVEPKTSTQLLANLAIAARLPIEYPTVLDDVYDTFGDRPIADKLFLTATLSNASEKICLLNTVGRGHYPFNPYVSLQKLRGASPTLHAYLSVGDFSNYIPNNAIWDTSERTLNSLSAFVLSKSKTKVSLHFQKYFDKLQTSGALSYPKKDIEEALNVA